MPPVVRVSAQHSQQLSTIVTLLGYARQRHNALDAGAAAGTAAPAAATAAVGGGGAAAVAAAAGAGAGTDGAVVVAAAAADGPAPLLAAAAAAAPDDSSTQLASTTSRTLRLYSRLFSLYSRAASPLAGDPGLGSESKLCIDVRMAETS